jgi:hypothetical protein
VFPAVARKVGRAELRPGWTTDQAVRALLLIDVDASEVQLVYRYGDAAEKQAVLKCVFAGVPLDKVDGLPDRADDELIRMMTDFAAERAAAGREIPTDLEPYLTASSPRRGV